MLSNHGKDLAASPTTNVTIPRTVVLGAGGYLGRHLLAAYRHLDPEALGTKRHGPAGQVLELASPDIRPLRLREQGYEYAIIAAAMTGLARCEQNPAYTRSCNVDGTLQLAQQLTQEGVVPIYFSTDNVFDGQLGGYAEESPTSPPNEYGAQKAEVEKCLPEVTRGRCLIARLGKVFGLTRGDGTILDEMANRLIRRVEVAAAWDQIMSLVLIEDVVKAVLALQEKRATGLFHVCCPEVWSRLDLAQAMADALGADPGLVRGISLDDLNEPFKRPKRGNLQCHRLRDKVNIEFRPIKACIAEMARQYQGGH